MKYYTMLFIYFLNLPSARFEGMFFLGISIYLRTIILWSRIQMVNQPSQNICARNCGMCSLIPIITDKIIRMWD